MIIVRFIEFLRDHLGLVKRLCYVVLTLLVLSDAFLVNKEHAHTIFEHFPGFWSLFGFIGCVVLIVVSKWFGHLGIMTREDYYDR